MRAFININQKAILSNFDKISKAVYPKRIFVVLKANAYGHGLQETAKLLSKYPNVSFVVATLEEALMVRKSLVFNNILLLENTDDYKTCINLKLTLAVHSLAKLNDLSKRHLQIPIHLNIDTGLLRDGIKEDEIDEAIRIIKEGHLNLKGIYTHHSDPLNITKENELFKNNLDKFKEFPHLTIHTGSSSSLDNKDNFTNAIRIGGAIYGLYKCENIELVHSLELFAPIWQVTAVTKGQPLGYGTNNHAPNDGYIYLLPIGYKDGFARSRKSVGYINGEILVQVCPSMMDHMMMFSKKKSNVNETVELIGPNLGIHELAKVYKTIPYEITSTLSERLKRNYL